MNAAQQIELMEKIVRELDDVKNSQTSVIKKLAQIEADNINLNSANISDELPDVHEEADDVVEKLTALIEKFTAETESFKEANPISQEES